MRQTGVIIADCLSHIVCQNTAEDNETLNLHVTALTTFQDGQNGWGDSQGELDVIYMHSGYIDSTCTSPMASL